MVATIPTIAALPLAGAEQVAMRDAWGQALVDLAGRYPNLLVLDGDLANSTKADIFAEAVPDRFLEMGIAEQNMLGVAAGLATVGFVPWISTFAAFLAKRALDQIHLPRLRPFGHLRRRHAIRTDADQSRHHQQAGCRGDRNRRPQQRREHARPPALPFLLLDPPVKPPVA